MNHDITCVIYRLCIEGKNQKSKSQGQRDGSNILIQYVLWGPYEWSGHPRPGGTRCLATAQVASLHPPSLPDLGILEKPVHTQSMQV